MRTFAAFLIGLTASCQAGADIVSFSAPPLYPGFNAGAGFTATQADGNAGHFFQNWEDRWQLTIDGRAPALRVVVDVPQDPSMSLSVASVWLRGPGIQAALPSSFTWLSPHAGLKKFELSFDRAPAGHYTLDLASGSNASGAYYIRITEVPEPAAGWLALVGAMAIGWRCRTVIRRPR